MGKYKLIDALAKKGAPKKGDKLDLDEDKIKKFDLEGRSPEELKKEREKGKFAKLISFLSKNK